MSDARRRAAERDLAACPCVAHLATADAHRRRDGDGPYLPAVPAVRGPCVLCWKPPVDVHVFTDEELAAISVSAVPCDACHATMGRHWRCTHPLCTWPRLPRQPRPRESGFPWVDPEGEAVSLAVPRQRTYGPGGAPTYAQSAAQVQMRAAQAVRQGDLLGVDAGGVVRPMRDGATILGMAVRASDADGTVVIQIGRQEQRVQLADGRVVNREWRIIDPDRVVEDQRRGRRRGRR